jgi:triacylglycerol esterase/lipase EstA (alpha/beta hydrolase family)
MYSKKLIFVVPGLRGTGRKWNPLLSRLQEDPALRNGEQVRWVFWPHGMRPWSCGSARQTAQNLRATITAINTADGPYDEIVLVGHSFGARGRH